MSFVARLAEAQASLEPRLDALLATSSSVPERLSQAMRHAVLAGGKRFRPFLVQESSRLLGAPARAAVEVAAAVELVHCYSLVHDDLPAMDNDRLRRGQPTVWVAYDEWTAILAGDALLTMAFEIIAGIGAAGAPPSAVAAIAGDLARASGPAGMVGGQVLDLDMERRQPGLRHGPDAVRAMQALKTGALIRFSCTAGAHLAGGHPGDLARLARYGDHLGYAFQISDDLLDALGDASEVGKATAKDAAAGKATLVAAFGVEGARRRLDEVVEAAVAELAPYGARGQTLVDAARFMSLRRS
jgi:farnesyl diphosphate synthase